MTHKERIALYLSGSADRETEYQIENAILEDAGLFEQFIKTSEQLAYDVPSGFADSIMRTIKLQNQPHIIIAPSLSKKMCAAVCFCSAAAIMLFTVFGLDRQLLDFMSGNSGKLNEILNIIKFF